ncbi:hypothetical protein AB1K54_08000 [Microbacterium sp. BWT-B31]
MSHIDHSGPLKAGHGPDPVRGHKTRSVRESARNVIQRRCCDLSGGP